MIYFLFTLIFLVSLSEKSVHHFAAHPGDFWPIQKSSRLHLLLLKIRPFSVSHFWLKVFFQILVVVGTVIFLMKNDDFLQSENVVNGSPKIAFWTKWMVVGLGFSIVFFLLDGLAHRLTVSGGKGFFSKKIIAFFLKIHGRVGQVFFSKQMSEKKTDALFDNEVIDNQSIPSGDLSEKKMLQGIARFDEIMVRQVMHPRTAVEALDFQSNFQEVLGKIRDMEYSRLPVFERDLDHVLGILYVKDLVPHLEKPSDFEWQSLVRTTFLKVPEVIPISELLADFKKEKLHLAIVIDEFGSLSGIATLEDILEEITGEIRDEFDEAVDLPFQKLNDHEFIFDGTMLLDDVCRVVGIESKIFESVRGDADTLAGLLLEIVGEIPPKDHEIEWGDFQFTVLASSRRRIEQVKLTVDN